MPRQLTFDLPVRTALGRDDFFVSPANADALATLAQRWPDNRLLLTGPTGAGKTHLAHVWAHEAGAHVVAATALADDLPAHLAAAGPVVVEDIDRLAGRAADEEALFHLLNAQAPGGAALLMTATRPPALAGIVLPDLLSRLQAVAFTRLAPPDDALLAAVIVKLFRDRQLTPGPDVVAYLVGRAERSFDAAQAIVSRLDALGLSEKRKVSVRLARRVLDKSTPPAS